MNVLPSNFNKLLERSKEINSLIDLIGAPIGEPIGALCR
jgi:hypothetical protein